MAVLTRWRRCYCAISAYIDHVNQFFGLVLLLHFARQYVNFVIFFFLFVTEMHSSKWSLCAAYYLTVCLKNVIHIAALVWLSDGIGKKVSITLQHLIDWSIHLDVALSTF